MLNKNFDEKMLKKFYAKKNALKPQRGSGVNALHRIKHNCTKGFTLHEIKTKSADELPLLYLRDLINSDNGILKTKTMPEFVKIRSH